MALSFDAPLSYPWHQQNCDDEVIISADRLSAHVGHLAGSCVVAVDQFLGGGYRISCFECPVAESAVGALLAVLLA